VAISNPWQDLLTKLPTTLWSRITLPLRFSLFGLIIWVFIGAVVFAMMISLFWAGFAIVSAGSPLFPIPSVIAPPRILYHAPFIGLVGSYCIMHLFHVVCLVVVTIACGIGSIIAACDLPAFRNAIAQQVCSVRMKMGCKCRMRGKGSVVSV
jgi:hypothetical protein